MKFRTRIVAAIFVIAAAWLTQPEAAQTQPASQKQKVTVTLVGEGILFSSWYIGMGAGFFAEEGIEVELLDVGTASRQIAGVMGGSSMIATSGIIQAIRANSEGADLVAVSSLCDIYDVNLFLSNDAIKKSGITLDMPVQERVRRLKGLRIGATGPGSGTDTALRGLFKVQGLNPDQEIRILPLGNGASQMAALQQGATDGFIYPAPYPQMGELQGLGKVVVDVLKGDIPELLDVPFLSAITTRRLIAEQPKTINGVVRGLTKSMKLAQEKPDQAKEFVRAKLAGVDGALFEKLWESYKKTIPKSPIITRESIVATQKMLATTAKESQEVKLESLVDMQFAQKAVADILGK